MKARLGGALVAAAVAWLGGCAPTTFVPPAQGGATWSQLTTKHFTLYTDAQPDDARAIALALEETQSVIEDAGSWHPQGGPGRVEITLFQNEDAFRQVAPGALLRTHSGRAPHFPAEAAWATFYSYSGRESHDPDRKPMVVCTGTTMSFHRHDNSPLIEGLQHLLTHRLVAHDLPSAPGWLGEGLAWLYETTQVAHDDQLRVGTAPGSFVFRHDSNFVLNPGQNELRIVRDELPSPAALTSFDSDLLYREANRLEAQKAKILYRNASWALARTMVLGPPPFRAAFARYLDTLRKGGEPRAAWAEALRANGVTPEKLEAEYQATLRRFPGDYEARPYAPRPQADVQARPMAEAEVRLLWARVRPWQGGQLPRIGAELDAALAADPNLVPAYLLRGEWRAATGARHADVLADLRKAFALAPGDASTAYELARYLELYGRKNPSAKAEVDAELGPLVEGLRRSAASAPALNFVALYDTRAGRHEAGLPFARKAVAADPTCFECYDTLAQVLYRLGRLDEALDMQRVGTLLTHDGAAEPLMVKRLMALKQDLAAAKASPRPSVVPAREGPPAGTASLPGP